MAEKGRQRMVCLVGGLALVMGLLLNMRLLERRMAHSEQSEVAVSGRLPPTLALTTVALGPLRGLIVDGLWWRLIQLQDEGSFFETIQLTDWITILQPRFPQVWAFNAWNMCYNVAYEFPSPEMRWKWIDRSIRLLRDEGLKYNPDDPVIRKELTRIFLDRIGRQADPGQTIFQRNWALTVMRYLSRGDREELESMREASRSDPAVIETPAVRELVETAAAVGIALNSGDDVLGLAMDDPRLAEVLSTDERREAWQRLRHYWAAAALEADLAMDLDRMLFIDREYGPFDWRLSQAHAVYWSVGGETFRDFLEGGDTQLRGLTRQAMEQSFHAGRLIYDAKTGFFMPANNLAIVGKIHDYYDRLLSTSPSANTHALHRQFLGQAAAVLYSYNRVSAARELYEHFREDYFTDRYRPSFEAFIVENLGSVLQGREYSDSRSTIHAALFQAYFWIAIGDRRRAKGYADTARLVWKRHQQRYAGSPNFLLPPLPEMKKAALAEIREGNVAGFIRERLSDDLDPDEAQFAEDEDDLYLGESTRRPGGHGSHGQFSDPPAEKQKTREPPAE